MTIFLLICWQSLETSFHSKKSKKNGERSVLFLNNFWSLEIRQSIKQNLQSLHHANAYANACANAHANAHANANAYANA